jgi:hypothetical protein
VYYDSTGADAGLKVWNGVAWVGVGEVTQSALDDTAAAIRADFPTGSAANTNAGAFYRWLKPDAQEIKTWAAGYGFIIDSTTNTDALTSRIDTTLISTRAWRDKLADSLGALIGGSGDAYTSIDLVNDTTFVLIRDDLTADTVVISGNSSANSVVDTIYRTPGIDSFYYEKGGVTYAVKDSIGSGGGGSSDFGIIQAASYNLTSSTSLQKLFDVDRGAGAGVIPVTANTTYEFECIFSISSMSATSGNCGFDIIGAGTATATSAIWYAVGRDAVGLNTSSGSSGMFAVTTAETGNILAAATGTAMYAAIKGEIRINGGGTIIPSVNLITAAAGVVGANSFFKLTPKGDGSITSW